MTRQCRICVIGSGYVGTVVAAGLAHIGHVVIGVESDVDKLGQLQVGIAPFHESGLDELLVEGLESGRLTFRSDIAGAMAETEVVYICVGTPPGANGEPDMRDVINVAVEVAMHVDGHVLVNKSTVPGGSGRWLSSLVEESTPTGGPTGRFCVVSNPEFLREGSAIDDFLRPDRIVLGSDSERALDIMVDIYRPVIEASETPVPVVRTDLVTAEVLKYASNAFLATKISFANELARMCELMGADVCRVTEGMGLDHRIGKEFLSAGLGWGGSCFGKDTAALTATARAYGYRARLLEAAIEVNHDQRSHVIELLQRHFHTLRGLRVTVLGLAFKPGTDDMRDSPAVDVVERLIGHGCFVSAHDPSISNLPEHPEVKVFSDPYAAVQRAEAVIIATDWPLYGQLDLPRLAMQSPGALLLDARNIVDPMTASAAGFHYQGIGRELQSLVDRRRIAAGTG
ncbi:MAG: UDP-glucose/GDP-mannose dehydrogenase family protein [Acidimicrobiales bacterium]